MFFIAYVVLTPGLILYQPNAKNKDSSLNKCTKVYKGKKYNIIEFGTILKKHKYPKTKTGQLDRKNIGLQS